MKKRLCVLQVTPSEPNQQHVDMFSEKEDCDFYFVTHDDDHQKALKYCPNTTWTDTRNVLSALVPKQYDYYAFVDYDYSFETKGDLNPLEQVLFDLEEFEPAVLTYYPGKGLITPFASDEEYYESMEYSIIPFTHCGLKIVHHSLMKWFFPMETKFGGGVDACHLFNILEIPFLKNVVCSHKMKYDNGVTDLETPHNIDGAYSKYRMDEMWRWIGESYIKKEQLSALTPGLNIDDSNVIKNFFVSVMKEKRLQVEKSNKKDFFDKERMSKFFDLSHERFSNIDVELEERRLDFSEEDLEVIDSILKKIEYSSLITKKDPWNNICEKINKELSPGKRINTSECVQYYQKLSPKSLFSKNAEKDIILSNFLKGKSVAFVGPSPYLLGKGRGSKIDSYDVVVRIQHDIPNKEDYGSRSDIIQSCLNDNYGPPLVRHIESLSEKNRPKFVICNDTACKPKSDGTWATVDEVYDSVFGELKVPFVNLKRKDALWDRWALYWEIYPKKHIEMFEKGEYTVYSANFNSGYGALCHLLSYDIKELAVFGIDFYNTGTPQKNEEKYNSEYIRTYGEEGTPYGPDKILHDQISQMMHCRNVLLSDDRFVMDKEIEEKILSSDVSRRIGAFLRLPKFQKTTR